jgi:hypothetical protein
MGVGWRSVVVWQSLRIAGFQGDACSVRGVQFFVRILKFTWLDLCLQYVFWRLSLVA